MRRFIGSGLSSFPNDIKSPVEAPEPPMGSGLSSFPNDIKYEHVKPLIFKGFSRFFLKNLATSLKQF